MAKKKTNVRRTYDLGKNDEITYPESRIPKQKQFMILRGPGLNMQEALIENEEIKKLAIKHRMKIKFIQIKSIEEAVLKFRDANTWASAVIYNLGSLTDSEQILQRTIKKILIPAIEIGEQKKATSHLEGIQFVLNTKGQS